MTTSDKETESRHRVETSDLVVLQNVQTNLFVRREGNGIGSWLIADSSDPQDGRCHLEMHSGGKYTAVTQSGVGYWLSAVKPDQGGKPYFGSRDPSFEFEVFTVQGGGIGGSPPVVAIRHVRFDRWWNVDPNDPNYPHLVRGTSTYHGTDVERFKLISLSRLPHEPQKP